MGSYLVFVVAGFVLVLFCLDAPSPSFVQPPPSPPPPQPSSLASSSSTAPAAAAAAESSVQKLPLKVTRKTSKVKVSRYSITERRVPEPTPLLGSQPAGGVSHKPGGRLPLLSRQARSYPRNLLRGLLPVSLLGEQRHDGCDQFALDCYPTASRLQFEPRPFCARVQHANHSATEPPPLKTFSHILLMIYFIY